MTIFIQRRVNTSLILEFIEEKTEMSVDAITRRRPDSPVYAQFVDYDEEFKLLLTLAGDWPSRWSDSTLATAITETFQTQTLVELDEPMDGKSYALRRPGRSTLHVNIIETEAGIRVDYSDVMRSSEYD